MERRIGSPNEDFDSAVTCKPTPRRAENTELVQREFQHATAACADPLVAGGQRRLSPAVIALMREVTVNPDRSRPVQAAHLAFEPAVARKQHAQFAQVLRELGATVKLAPACTDNADSVFLENAAFLVPEVGITARPREISRMTEIETVIPLLAQHRPIQRISDPATLEASDVMRIGRTVFLSETASTNAEGLAELKAIIGSFGYHVRSVELRDCAHLKLAASFVPPHYLLVNPACVVAKEFGELVTIEVDEREKLAASTLSINGTTLVSSAFPKTERRLRAAGISTRRVDIGEFHKLGAGVSSLGLLIEPRVIRPASAPVGFKVVKHDDAPVPAEIFAPAIVHGGVVYVSGLLPIDPATGRAVAGEIERQTEQILRNLSDVLTASGSSLGRVLRLTFYVVDPKAVDRVTAICAKTFTSHRPAGSVVAAKALQAGCAIAVDAIAAVTNEN